MVVTFFWFSWYVVWVFELFRVNFKRLNVQKISRYELLLIITFIKHQ